MKPHFTPQDHKDLCKDALFLFANKEPRDTLNFQRLRACRSHDNPVARIKAITRKDGRFVSNNKHYDEDSIPACIVMLKCPLLETTYAFHIGLFNGSIGSVLDIVLKQNKSPNNFDLPAYVLVEFTL